MKCPVCSKEGEPLCPFYEECKFRKARLAPLAVCWLTPDFCQEYNARIGKLPLMKNPSSRDFGDIKDEEEK